MNFLEEVLLSAEKIDVERVRRDVPVFSTKLIDFKEEIEKFFNDVYVTFSDFPRKSNKLSEAAVSLSGDINELQDKIDYLTKRDVSETMKDLSELGEDLEKSRICLNVITQMIKIHDSLSTIQHSTRNNNFKDLAHELLLIEAGIENIPCNAEIGAIDELRNRALISKLQILHKITQAFNETILIERHETVNVVTNTIKIRKDTGILQEILSSLALLHYLSHVNIFEYFLLNQVLQTIVNNVTNVFTKEEDFFNILAVVVKDSGKKPSYQNVFRELTEVFDFLYKNFNFDVKEGFTFMSYLSGNIRDKLSEELIKNCLSATIPSKSEDLLSFDKVIKDTEIFEKTLIDYKIFPEDCAPLISYVNNVDELFISKKCQEYLATATNIMKRDLHDMVEIKDHETSGNDLVSDAHFPKCCVSRSVLELLALAKEILSEITRNSDYLARRLVNTVQDILYSYGTNTREYHRKFLETIPQHVALFYNNCLYLAFNLYEWNQAYTFPDTVLPSPPIFKDQAHHLQTVGNEVLNTFVVSQIKMVEEIIENSQLSNLQSFESLDPSTEKYVRQCLRQHELLKTVWQKVLPLSVYNKTVGCILNSFCNALIKSVLKVEDISSNTAEQLVEIYKVVLSRAPKLFHNLTEVPLYVESWSKFIELVFILDGSLVDIDDRWGHGKGSLAMHFKADEIKRLIRALFQNTDRRAAVLNCIH